MADLDNGFENEFYQEDDSLVLELADLLPDESGEVVLFMDEDIPVNLVAGDGVREAGIAEGHVTAAGVDVTGYHYYSFENGITVYGANDVMIVQNG